MCALPFFFPSQGVCVRVCVSRPLRLVVLGKAPGLPPSPRPPFQVSPMVAVRQFQLFRRNGEMGRFLSYWDFIQGGDGEAS